MTILFTGIFAQAAGATNDYSFLILLGGMFIIFYLFMIRPQLKKQKEANQFRSSIDVGDAVVTIGGLHGKVISVNESTVVLKLDDGKARVDLAAISPTSSTDEMQLKAKK